MISASCSSATKAQSYAIGWRCTCIGVYSDIAYLSLMTLFVRMRTCGIRRRYRVSPPRHTHSSAKHLDFLGEFAPARLVAPVSEFNKNDHIIVQDILRNIMNRPTAIDSIDLATSYNTRCSTRAEKPRIERQYAAVDVQCSCDKTQNTEAGIFSHHHFTLE